VLDRGRALCGMSGLAGGEEAVVISTDHAHTHQFPCLSTNTVVHEICHLLRGDPEARNPGGWNEQIRELALDRVVPHLHYGFAEANLREWIDRRWASKR
jgi:hypothetical protein